MLKLKEVSYETGGCRLLDGVTHSFSSGQFTAIIGPNGAGKTTLLRILSGFLEPTTGEVQWGDQILNRRNLAEISRRRAYLSQDSLLHFPFSVYDVVALGRFPHCQGRLGKADRFAVTKALEVLRLESWQHREYTRLSGGERRRVDLARALAQIDPGSSKEPTALLLDEPLAGLDIHHQYQVLEHLREISATHSITLLAILHDLRLAQKFADQLILLNGGHLVSSGKPTEVLTPERLHSVFKVETLV